MSKTHRLKPVLVLAIQYSGTTQNIRDLEAHFGRAESIWEHCIRIAGCALLEGQWLVRFLDTGEVKVYSNEAFQLRFETVS